MHVTQPLHQELGRGPSSIRTTILKPLVLALWGLVVGGGLLSLSTFANTAGAFSGSSKNWPSESSLVRRPGSSTVLFFAHPRCSCTLASLEQLKSILAEAPQSLCCHVVFLVPCQRDPAWEASPLVREAQRLPGVTITMDEGGEAQRFGVTTSGHSLMYDAEGELVFSGGLTLSRGHRGDCPGSQTLTRILHGEKIARREIPTFGCALVQNRSQYGKDNACRY